MPNLKHSKFTWRQLTVLWKLQNHPSKALGRMHAQHFFIAGTFGNDRSTTTVVLSRALSYEPTNSESVYALVIHLHIAGPTITPALLTLHVIHELKIRHRWNMHNRCKLSKIVNFFQILLYRCRRHRFGKSRFLLTETPHVTGGLNVDADLNQVG